MESVSLFVAGILGYNHEAVRVVFIMYTLHQWNWMILPNGMVEKLMRSCHILSFRKWLSGSVCAGQWRTYAVDHIGTWGGFVYNDSQSRQAQLMYRYFRDHGYACASVNYRLAQEAAFPAGVEDVKSAIRFSSCKCREIWIRSGAFRNLGRVSWGGFISDLWRFQWWGIN